MVARIQRLDENLIKKIAAGEVVERPASVVKELVENSIDAGAVKIRVAIRGGGKQAIVVADDGKGMDREDISMCVHRHATSKMSSASDLFQIETLGFRGEALASIGAVSHLAIESRAAESEEGTRLVIEGGIEREMHGIGRARGTTITVRNLFFNTPARRKFLRHIDTETRHISQVLVHLAASYPAIGFELEHQDRPIMNYVPASRKERAADLLGIAEKGLLEVAYEEKGLSVEGVIATPENCNRSRGKQYIVVRGRPIHSRSMVEAVTRGYGGLLPDNRYPVFMLWLDMDPRKIDVNVHPTKREIRLADEALVVAAIEGAIRQSLRMPDTQSFVYDNSAADFKPAKIGEPPVIALDTPVELGAKEGEDAGGPLNSIGHELNPQPEQLAFSLVAPSMPKGDSNPGDIDPAILRQNTNIWQIHNQYIIVQVADGILIVDQQAAHERIRYSHAMAKIGGMPGESQQLLFPFKLEMGSADFAVFDELREDFAKLGFDLRDFGERTVLIEAIPVELDRWGEGEFFYQLLNDARDGRDSGRSWREAIVLAYARKTSIRKGQKLGVDEMKHILDQLFETDEPHLSPSAKPVIAKVQLSDIDRLFRKL